MTLSSGPQFPHLSEGYHGNPSGLLGCCEQKLVKTMSSVVVREKQQDKEGQGGEGDGYK